MKNIVCMATIVAASSGAAFAADFQAAFTGIDANATTVSVAGFTGGIQGGYMNHSYVGPIGPGFGQFATANFHTFCVELQTVAAGTLPWEIVDLAAAPNPQAPAPGAPAAYGSGIAGQINAIVAAAIRLGWIAGDLSGATSNQATAIQGGIWAAIGANGAVIAANAVNGDDTLVDPLWTALFNEYSSDTSATVSGLRAMTNPSGQDMLYVVPLPPAAFAGLATLVGIAGVSRLRRR